MTFRYQQSTNISNSPERDPFRLTISEFKFKPVINSSHIPKISANPEMQNVNMSRQIPRRGLSFRLDKEKRLERLTSIKKAPLSEEPRQSSHGFKNWQQRAKLTKKIIVPADKILLEMMKTSSEYEMKRSESERKIASSHFDVDVRRTKVHTATKIKENSPMELLTRKLQWRGRQIKKITRYTGDSKNLRTSPIKEESPNKDQCRFDNLFLSNLKGWQPQPSQDYWLS